MKRTPLTPLSCRLFLALLLSASAVVASACQVDNSRPFTTTLWITTHPADEWLTLNDLKLLGQVLVDTYNSNCDGFCDPYQRRLSTAEARYTEEEVTRLHNNNDTGLTIRYDLEGFCDGCQKEGKGLLFDATTTQLRRKKPCEDNCRNSSALPRAPHQSEFLQSFREALAALRAPDATSDNSMAAMDHRHLTSVVELSVSLGEEEPTRGSRQDLIDVDEYDCPAANQGSFYSTVFVRVQNHDNTDLQALQDSFQAAYNNLTFQFCDVAHFRQVVNVTALPSVETAVQPAMDELWWGMDTATTTLIALRIETQCQNCNATTSLFHVLPQRATLAPEEVPEFVFGGGSSPGRPFGGSANARPTRSGFNINTCLCPKNETNVFRAPTTEELQTHLQQQTDSPILLLQVAEEERLDCSSNTQQQPFFTTYANVDWDVKWDTLRQQEQTLLELAFQETYNQVAYQHCVLRQITNVTLLPDHVGTTLELSPSTQSPSTDLNLTRSTVFRIQADCYDCDDEFSLFDPPKNGTMGPSLTVNSSSEQRHLLEQQLGVCTCAPGTVPGGGPLSEDDFLQALNQNLDELLLQLQAVESATDVVEGTPVPCGSNETRFASRVLADVSLDINTSTPQERQRLEESFAQVYNNLTFHYCDGNFRTILNITLQTESDYTSTVNIRENDFGRRLLIGGNNETAQNVSKVMTAAVFSVVGTCRNCNVSPSGTFTLFDDAFRRRRVLQDNKAGVFDVNSLGRVQRRQLHDNSEEDLCLCPIGRAPALGQGPTSDQFQASLNDRISELQQEGNLPPVVGNATYAEEDPVTMLVEIHPVGCSDNLTRFQSAVYTGLRVNQAELTPTDTIAIQDGFRSVFNNQNFLACDRHFRTITNVEIMVGDVVGSLDNLGAVNNPGLRRLQDDLNSTMFLNTTNATNVTQPPPPPPLVPTYFVVTGQCRNCPVSRSGSFQLFDDTFRRRLEQSMAATMSLIQNSFAPERSLQTSDDTCFCPSGVEPGNSISSREFLPVFDDVVMESTESDVVGVPDNKVGIVEVDIACTEMELTVVEFKYAVLIPVDVLALPDADLRSFLFEYYPQAYNELTVGECSPVLVQTDIIDRRRRLIRTERRRLIETQKVILRIVVIVPLRDDDANDTGSKIELFEDQEQEENVAVRLQEIFESSPFRGIVGFVVREVSSSPSAGPTAEPTPAPTRPPTREPTPEPTPEPTSQPTPFPTPRPSSRPTPFPTPRPSSQPTPFPTPRPSSNPSRQPSLRPSTGPSEQGSGMPSAIPSAAPSDVSSSRPSVAPTKVPTGQPTARRASLVRFDLIDVSNGSIIREVKNGDVLDRALLPEAITIEAITDPIEIIKVVFFLNGEMVQEERKAPYSLSGNFGNGAFKPSTRLEPSDSPVTLEAIPIWYWGLEGKSLTVTFTVIRSSSTRRSIRRGDERT